MQKHNFYNEKAFPIVYLISFYAILLASLFLTKLDTSKSSTVYISFAIPQIFYIASVFIYTKIANVDIFKAIPVTAKVQPIKYLWVTLVTVGVFCFALLPNVLVSVLLEKMGFTTTITVPVMNNPMNIILGLLIICVMPAIGEELMFRGVLASSFRNYGGVLVILLSGLLFSISHFNSAQTVYQLFLGMLLCYIYIKTNNIIFPMIIHFLNNALALFLPSLIPFFREINLDAATLAVLSSLCIVGLLLVITALRKLTDETKKGDSDVIVFEYNADSDDFVAVGRESEAVYGKNKFFKRMFKELRHTFHAIIHTFKKGEIKKRIRRFSEIYPRRAKINTGIKILFAFIIVIWIATIALSV